MKKINMFEMQSVSGGIKCSQCAGEFSASIDIDRCLGTCDSKTWQEHLWAAGASVLKILVPHIITYYNNREEKQIRKNSQELADAMYKAKEATAVRNALRRAEQK